MVFRAEAEPLLKVTVPELVDDAVIEVIFPGVK
jgi:hypothetical protein